MRKNIKDIITECIGLGAGIILIPVAIYYSSKTLSHRFSLVEQTKPHYNITVKTFTGDMTLSYQVGNKERQPLYTTTEKINGRTRHRFSLDATLEGKTIKLWASNNEGQYTDCELKLDKEKTTEITVNIPSTN